MRRGRVVWVALALVFAAGATWGQAYDVNNFDVYKYSTDGDGMTVPVPDVDKVNPADLNDKSCWLASAANVLGAAGYGVGAGAGATAQQRANRIYGHLTNDLTILNPGFSELAVNYWLYAYGKNPDNTTGDYQPGNVYTDVTAERRPLHLTTVGVPNDYDFLLDELVRCQYVNVSFDMQTSDGHCMTLVGGNYWNSPNNPPDGNRSIWHDSDRDAPDTVVNGDDDVYINAGDAAGLWTLSDYVTLHASGYMTLCPGLNKPQYVVENYDVAYLRVDPDKNGVWTPDFLVSGAMQQIYTPRPDWEDDNTVIIYNEEIKDWEKEVYLLVDYIDRVPGRENIERIFLSALDPNTGGLITIPATSVTPNDDNGQLLFYWDLDFQPGWEMIIFPDERYFNLYDPTGEGEWSDVKDWNIATNCGIPEPATMTLVGLGLVATAWMRRRRRA